MPERVVEVAVTDRILGPGVEGLAGEAQHPAGHRDGDREGLVIGKVTDQRERHFGDWPSFRFACDK